MRVSDDEGAVQWPRSLWGELNTAVEKDWKAMRVSGRVRLAPGMRGDTAEWGAFLEAPSPLSSENVARPPHPPMVDSVTLITRDCETDVDSAR